MSVLIDRDQLMPSRSCQHSASSRRIRVAQWFNRRYVLHLIIPAPLASLRVRKRCNRLNKTWLPSMCRRSPNLSYKGHSPSLTPLTRPIGARTDLGGKCGEQFALSLGHIDIYVKLSVSVGARFPRPPLTRIGCLKPYKLSKL